MLTILEGSTFCISDDLGDISGDTAGLFASDTRFLSRLVLRVDGEAPLLLSSGRMEHFAAAFFTRNRAGGSLPHDSVSISRERFVGSGLQERIGLRNESMDRLEFELSLELAADFADIISVKNHDFALGDPENADPLPPAAPATLEDGGHRITIEDPRGDLRTRVRLSRSGRVEDDALVFDVALDPHERWDLSVDVSPVLDGEPSTDAERRDEERETIGDAVAAWTLRVPRVRGGWESLRRSFDRSIADLAALRMRTGGDRRPLFAAGMPWFMTVFGRDTLITSLQTLLLGPELAVGALDALAELQSEVDDPSLDAEPGKIVHEVRRGQRGRVLVPALLRHGRRDTALPRPPLGDWRWTDDAALAARLREPALEALAWIDEYGDLDGDGFVEYVRRSGHGLVNQSWKDSGDSQRFHDGRHAEPPIAPVEVQGYVYARQARPRRARARGLARPWTRGPARAGGRGAARSLRRGVLGRGPRRVLRSRPRSREAACRRALLEHRASPVERDRAAREGGDRGRPAPRRAALVGLGGPDDGE